MAAVSIRDLDDDVHDRLRVRAARNGRSMEAEMRAILTAAANEEPVARLPDGARRAALERAADEVFRPFADDVLPFDLGAATAYAAIVGERGRLGRPSDGLDAQIAAICRVHGAMLATRNERDFAETGVTTADPWQG